MDYRLHKLNDEWFEDLVVDLFSVMCWKSITWFTKGPDWWKDARFEWTAACFPNKEHPWSWFFVIQAKHTNNESLTMSEWKFFGNTTSIVSDEISKIKKIIARGQSVDCYILVTNRKTAWKTHEEIESIIKRETGVVNVCVLGYEWLMSDASGLVDFVQKYDLNFDRRYLQFNALEFASLVNEIYDSLNVDESESSDKEVFTYTQIDKKSDLNNVWDGYRDLLKEWVVYHQWIFNFLKKHESLAQKYKAIIHDIRCQIANKREEYLKFDDILEEMRKKITSKLSNSSNILLVSYLITFAFVVCDIGKKTDEEKGA